MGHINRNEIFNHVPPEKALDYFNDFFWWKKYRLIKWKNYVYAEHVRFIAEEPSKNTFFGRSLTRSVQAFGDPTELNRMPWWVGYIAIRNPVSGNIQLTAVSPPMSSSEYRRLYKLASGTARW